MELEKLKIDRSATPARRPRRSGGLGWLVVLALVAGLGWLFRGPLGRTLDRLTLPTVAVYEVFEANPAAASAASGTSAGGYIVARNRAALSADTPGRIVEMNVEEGSVVKAGDVVARLFSEEFSAALRRTEAELAVGEASLASAGSDVAAARANLETLAAQLEQAQASEVDAQAQIDLAQKTLARESELLEGAVQSRARVDEAETSLLRARALSTSTQAGVRAAQAALVESERRLEAAQARQHEAEVGLDVHRASRDQAQATLDKTAVRAPFDGVVVLKDAELGEVVSPSALGGGSRGSVVTLVDFSSLEVQVELPETSLESVRVGESAEIFLDAFPGRRFGGRVDRIWPTANRQKATVEVRVVFEELAEVLRPEMGVRVVFAGEAGAQRARDVAQAEGPSILLPQGCLVRVDGVDGAFVLERDVARWRRIEVDGEARRERVRVKSGLQAGERVVLDPPADLEDGDRVRIQG